MPGPLSGLRIVDVTQMISGPLATRILADRGADVIQVEPPTGDLTRGLGGARRAVRNDLVSVSISGCGERGPSAHKRVYDPLIQALSGLAAIQADGETGRPRMVRLIVPDKLTALTAAQAITAALLARERTGRGQHVRLSMLDAMVSFLWPEGMAGYTWVGEETDASRAQLAQDLVFRTVDGWLTAGAVSDAEWRGMARAAGHPEWIDDPRFATPDARVRNVEARLELMAAAIATRSTAEWLERFDAEQVPCAPILRRGDLVTFVEVQITLGDPCHGLA